MSYQSARPIVLSGQITAGGTAQELCAARGRRGLCVQNQSAGDLWVNDRGTAAADNGSIKIAAGALYEFPCGPVDAVSILGATAGQAFYCREW